MKKFAKKMLSSSLIIATAASQLFFASLGFAESSKETLEITKTKKTIEHNLEQPTLPDLPRRIGRNIRHIVTAPKRMDRRDYLKLGAVLTATGLLIKKDDELLEKIKREGDDNNFFYHTKRFLGDARFVGPGLGGLYVIGALTKSEREKETAVRGLEALTVAGLSLITLQYITGRERPEKGGKFNWFEYGHFPAGDTTVVSSIAPIIDHQYCKIDPGDSNSEKLLKYLGKAIIHGSVGTVAYHRLKTGSHYPSDVFASVALGLCTGNMVNKLNDREQSNWEIMPEVRKNFTGLKLSRCW